MSDILLQICDSMFERIGYAQYMSDDSISIEAGYWLSYWNLNTPENRSGVLEFYKNWLDKR